MIKQLLNSVIAEYLDLSCSHRSIDRQDTDISRYFAQLRLKNCQILQRETPISRLPFLKWCCSLLIRGAVGICYTVYQMPVGELSWKASEGPHVVFIDWIFYSRSALSALLKLSRGIKRVTGIILAIWQKVQAESL